MRARMRLVHHDAAFAARRHDLRAGHVRARRRRALCRDPRQVGPVALAVTTNLNINFLRKPAPADLIGEARLIKLGKRLAVGEVSISRTASERSRRPRGRDLFDPARATMRYHDTASEKPAFSCAFAVDVASPTACMEPRRTARLTAGLAVCERQRHVRTHPFDQDGRHREEMDRRRRRGRSSSAGSPRSSRCGCAASTSRPSPRTWTTATTSSSSTPTRWCSPAASASRRSITTTPAISAASRSAPPRRSSRASSPSAS